MRKMLLTVCTMLLVCVQMLFAQTNTVKGTVLDNNGDPVPGASIVIKGTQAGAIADVDGNFEIFLPEGSDVLIVRGLGLADKEVRVTEGMTSITIELEAGSQSITEVEIYGRSIDPRTNTGSVTTVTAEDIARKPITNVIRALDAAPGIQLTSGGGQPGSSPEIHVRGFGSLSASTAPLVVLDGSVYDGPLESINPNDIETMSLLKDATASSLYGARGANGVILVTSKRGRKSDKPNINVDAQVGFVNRMLPPMETVDERQYYELGFQTWKNYLVGQDQMNPDGTMPDRHFQSFWSTMMQGYNPFNMEGADLIDPTTGKINPSASLLYSDNWIDEVSRTGLRQQYNVSVSNGDGKSDYYFSLGYNSDQGIINYTSFDRITAKLNLNSQITGWLRSGMSFTGGFEESNNFVTTETAYVNPFFSAQMVGPIFPVYRYDESGNRMIDPVTGDYVYDFGNNPDVGQQRRFANNTNVIASLINDKRGRDRYSVRGLTYLEAKFLDDFTLRTDISLDYFNNTTTAFQNMLFGDARSIDGRIRRDLATQYSYTFRQMLSWSPSFGLFENGDHSLNATVAHENYLLDVRTTSFSRTGFTQPSFVEGDAAAVNERSGSVHRQLAMESYLALADYDYLKRYFFSASIRRDGTSRFATDARWGNFWSVGGGWSIGQENFMSDISWLSALKLKLSYGVQGNENLGSNYYSWMPTYYFSSNENFAGYLFNTWGNPELKWENQYMLNAGIDFGFLNDRIRGSLDVYQRGSDDLLYVRPYAPSTGIGGIQDNVGSMQNAGVELALAVDVVRSTDFMWVAQLNLQHYKNKVTKMQGGDNDSIIGGITLMAEDLPVNTFFMPKFAGVDPENGDELWELADGGTTNDHTIANLRENRQVMGSGIRDLEGAFINTIRYKNLDFSFQLNFGIGGKFYDRNYQQLMGADNVINGFGLHVDALNSWTYDNKDAELPRLDPFTTNIGNASDRFLMSNSFFKIQNINLGYTIPAKYLSSLKFNSLRVYVAADNVFLLAGRKGVDIQESYFGTSSLSYFPYRSVMFGVNVGL